MTEARPDGPAGTARLFEVLTTVCDALERADIWHSLAFGTLLGATRDGDLIAWDHDFDLLARPSDRARIVALGEQLEPAGISIKYAILPAEDLAIVPPGATRFNASALVVFDGDTPVGDIYTYTVFGDGVLRQYDLTQEIYWCARNSFPAWFCEGRSSVSVRGRELPGLRSPERWLAHVYGDDWHVPYRCVQRGGEPKDGMTTLGDRLEPDLGELVRWCEAAGWGRAAYAAMGLPEWPRAILGAGPGRWRGDDRGIEWATLEELAARY